MKPARLTVLLLVLSVATPAVWGQSSREKRIEGHLKELESGFGHSQGKAINALLVVDPKSVSSDLRKRIARAFREQVLEAHGHNKGAAVQGLVHWAGKYSTPVLVEMIHAERTSIDEAVFDALIELEDPEGIEAVASLLDNFFNHEEAVECLKAMGPAAEDAVINVAKARPGDASARAIEVLSEIGGERSLTILRRLASRGPAEQRSAAKLASARIRGRLNATPATEETPPEIDDDNPFAVPVREYSSGAIGTHPEEGVWDNVLQPLADRPEPGAFRPDPVAAFDKPPRFKPVRLKGDIHARPAGVLLSRNDPTKAVVVIKDPFEKKPAYGQLFDLRLGRAARTFEFPPDTVRAALSPSGRRLVTLAEDGKRMRIDVWELAHREPKLLDSWRPFDQGEKMFSEDPMWAAWIDEERFAMLNRAGDLVVWKAEGAVAEIQLSVEGWSQPTISPGGNQVAGVTKEGLAIFDLKSGDTLVWLEGVGSSRSGVGFDQSGQRLACVDGSRVRVWDLTSGQTTSDFHVMDSLSPSSDFSPSLDFYEEDRLIVRGSRSIDVIDLTQRRVLARGEHTARGGTGFGKTTLMMSNSARSGAALYPERAPTKAEMPSPEVDPESLLAIRPGAEVSLDVRVSGGLAEETRKVLSKAIADAGLKLVANSTNNLVARTETKSETVEYRKFGTPYWDRDGTKKVNVNEKIYTVTLFIDGESAWRYLSTQRAQHMLRTKQGESFQQASDRQMKASAGYFSGIEIPSYLVAPEHAGPLQTAKLRGG